MSNHNELLSQYVSDLLALEKYILEAVERQIDSSKVNQYPEASAVFSKMKGMLTEHVEHLERRQETFNSNGVMSTLKEGITAVMGVAAGLYDEIRRDDPARMLRDDYTALSLTAISYTMLHTASISLNDGQTAEIAFKHLTDITPLIIEISEAMPMVVGKHLVENGQATINAGPQSRERTQRAWQPKIIN